MNSVKTNKHIFIFFSLLGSQTILVFPYQTAWQYSDGNLLTGASNAGGVGRNPASEPIIIIIIIIKERFNVAFSK